MGSRDATRQGLSVRSFAAGYIAGAAGQLVGHPLDTLKVHAQASSSPAKLHLSTLFRGVSLPVATSGAVQAANLGIYENVRRGLASRPSMRDSPLVCHGVSAAAAGLAITPVTAPLNRIKVLQQMHGGTMWATARAVRATRTMYVGSLATALIESSRGIYIVAYELLKRRVHAASGRSDPKLPLWMKSVAGAGANVVSWSVVYPFDVIRSVQQAAFGQSRPPSLAQCAVELWATGGVQRLYRGLGAALFRAGPVAGTILPLFEFTLERLER
jgi:solute carrier family 25 carnitine/acylcarnitine transporter 20/29